MRYLPFQPDDLLQTRVALSIHNFSPDDPTPTSTYICTSTESSTPVAFYHLYRHTRAFLWREHLSRAACPPCSSHTLQETRARCRRNCVHLSVSCTHTTVFASSSSSSFGCSCMVAHEWCARATVSSPRVWRGARVLRRWRLLFFKDGGSRQILFITCARARRCFLSLI